LPQDKQGIQSLCRLLLLAPSEIEPCHASVHT
jgi:hypothetical protein